MELKQRNIIVGLLGTVFFILMILWLFHDPTSDLSESMPGADNRPAVDTSAIEEIIIGEKFMKLADHKSNLKGKWTRFRGKDFDNIVKDKTPLIDKWNEEPKILWSHILGEGHAAPVIQNGKVYILDYEEAKKSDQLRCFSLETGEELWRRGYRVHMKRNHGISRTVPAITEDYIITIGPRCQVMCVDPENGDFLWGSDLVEEYNSTVPFWYTGQCPLIDGDEVIIAPGGSSLMVGLDIKTGEVKWKSPNPNNWNMSHSSIFPMTLNGKKMYVYGAVGGICGISAEENDKGKILWETNAFMPTVVAPSPVILPDGKIYMTAGYGAGAILFKVNQSGNNYSVEVLQNYKPKDGICSEQQTPIVHNGRMFSVQPKDAGGIRNQFVCVDPSDCQTVLWTSGKEERFGLGPYVIADGKFFILNDDGTLFIAKASTEKFELLDKRRIIDGHDAWGPLAIADGYLVMRDSKKMVCIDIRK